MILVLFLYAILAATFTIGKTLLLFVPPLFLTGMRMIFSGVVLLTVYYLFSKDKVKIKLSDFFMLCLISIIHIFIPYATEYIAMSSISPSCAALLYNLSPFFSALFSYLYFSETMTKTKWLGAAISFSGILYFIKPSISCFGSISTSNIAYILLLIGVATSSLAWVVIRMFVKDKNYSIFFINGIAMFLGGIESFTASYCLGEKVNFPWKDLYTFIILFLSIVLISNLFYNFYGYLLKKYTATFLSFIGVATPLIVALYDWIFLGIKINQDFFITLILISIGVYLFYKEELKQGYILN